jgi:hypothetical protein
VRKAFVIAVVLGWILLGFVNVMPTGAAAPSPYSWTDHIDYSSLAEMEAGGWTISTPEHTFLNQSSVALEYVDPAISISYRGFPSGIYNWSAEIRGMWTEGSGGNVVVNVVTGNHSYAFSLDGWYSDFRFYRDSVVVMEFGARSLVQYQWYIMTMEMNDGDLTFYLNGEFINNYTESSPRSQAIGIDSVSPWLSTTQYDYYHFEALEGSSHPSTWTSWRDVIGGPGSDVGYSAVSSGDGGYVLLGVTRPVGAVLFDTLLVRVDFAGNVLWSHSYDRGNSDYSYSIVNCSDGGFVIAGAAYNASLSQYQIWLFKVDASGTLVWDRLLGNGTYDAAFGLAKTNDGGYVITGYKNWSDVYLIKTDSLGIAEWERTYGGTGDDWGKCVIQTLDGGYAIAGWTESYSTNTQAYIIRTSADGTLLWENHFGNGTSYAYGLVEMPDGGFVLSGHTDGMGSGLMDFYAVRTDVNGNLVWENAYGGSANDYGFSVFRVDGGLVFGGNSSSFDPAYSKIFMVGTDEEGNVLWNFYLGLNNVTVSGSIAIHNPDGSFLAVGNTNTYTNGNDDLFAMRVAGGAGLTLPPAAADNFFEEAAGPVAAILVGSGIGILAVALASSGNALMATASSKAATTMSGTKSSMIRGFRFNMIEDFVIGYLKSHVAWKLFKFMGKVEPEKGVAQQRNPVLFGFHYYELAAMAFASVVLGITFMIAGDLDLLRPDLVLLYIFFAGLVLIVDDLTHRYMAKRYKAVTEYQFWFLGSVIMFVTALLFGSVFALPARVVINDTDKLSKKQRAMIYGAGPLMSFALFVAFMALTPLGGAVVGLAILGASMHLLSAVYSFMPFDPMDGNKVYRWRRLVWLMAFAPLLVLYFAMVIWVF